VIRDHWRELAFWRWWWRNRVHVATKLLLAAVVLTALVAGGWLASARLPSAGASSSPRAATVVRTYERLVTIRSRQVIARRVPVVRTVYVANRARPQAPKTVRGVTTVQITRTLARTVVRTVPAVAPKRTAAATRTVARPVTVTTRRTVTVTATRPVTVTRTKTVSQWRVISVVQKPTTVTATVTVTSP
jgi:hypothetical protein